MRTGEEAANYARSRVGSHMPDSGLCLQFTRQNYPVNSYYYSAIDAWNAAQWKHPDDRDAPPGTPVWFWSSSPYRHVAIAVGDGEIVTTYNDEIRIYNMGQMESIYGGYLGWAEDLNRVRIWEEGAPPPIPEPPKEDASVGTYFEATSSDGPIIANWVYEQGANGVLRALGPAEASAHRQVHPQAYDARARWSGKDLNNLVRACGLYEYTGTAQTTPIGLTGRVIGRNAPTSPPNSGGSTSSIWPGATVQADVTGRVETASLRRWGAVALVLLVLILIALIVLLTDTNDVNSSALLSAAHTISTLHNGP